ncbi:MAG: transcriptional regulator [marine bacterium B5-7]|nr:MAG: transcriptional regulator [marine bacterium B5-7]
MDTILELLKRLGVLTQAENRQIAGLEGLQPVHLDVLRYLTRCNRYSNTPAAVGQYLNTTKGTVSQSINVLEREKLISKYPDANDGRVVRLRLLKKGLRLLDRPAHKSSIVAAISDLGKKEQDGLEKGLAELLRRAQRRNDSKSFGICHTCRFFHTLGKSEFQCGITQERLTREDSHLICVEHEVQQTAWNRE